MKSFYKNLTRAVVFLAILGSQKINAQCVETKIYETVNPSRDGSGSIVYVTGFGKTGGAASAFTGSFNRVKYRMENNVAGVLRWAEVSFDAWTGLTVAGLQIPDHINSFTIQRNVFNIEVASNLTGVNVGRFDTGRIEMWPWDYLTSRSGLTPAGDAGMYDWDDVPMIGGTNGHGSFQIHNVSNGFRQTIFGWNMQRNGGPAENGIGNSPTGGPDWTFNTSNGTTNFKVQISVFSSPTITASTPASRCGTGTVILGATASAGTLNWYSAATGGTSLGTGTSFTTPVISATTTYYVDATNNGCVSGRTAVVATVTAGSAPTITASTPASRCGTGTVVLGATASAGTINWYSAATGGTSLATGTSFTTPSIAATTTYYVDATASGCTTATRTAITATVNVIPTITASTPASRCGTGTAVLGATASAGTINWYSALTGGTSVSTGTSFTTPSISATTTYYVDATANGCTTAARTAVVATVNAIPTAIATAATTTTFCTGGSVVVNANTGTGLTYQWLNNNAPIATATSASYTATAAGSYRVLVSNASGCRDTSTAVAVIVNTIPTITASTPAAICGTGTAVLGATASAGTINWYSALTGGTSLATGASFTTPSITATTTYYADATANGCTTATRTAVTATVNAIPTITASTPASRCGTGTVALGATASAGTINWYSALTGGTSIATGVSFTTPSITATTTYYVDATANGCTTATRTAVVATVNAIPTATATAATTTTLCTGGSVVVNANTGTGLTYQWLNNNAPIATATNASYTATAAGSYRVLVSNASGCRDTSTAVAVIVNTIPTITASTPAAICGTGTAVLGATASAGTINWYSALTGGTSLATGASFTTPSITATTTYYADATANGCTTAARTSVAATVNAIPTITASTPAAICGTGTVVLGATASAGTINWYSAATGGTSLGTGASFTTPSISATTNYFVDATANGCTTATRTSVAATVNAIPTITASTPANRCGTGTVVLGATASAGIINWYSAATGGTSLGTGTTFTTPSISATTNYFVDATANGCTTSTRTAVAATVNAIPTITAIAPASRCGTGTVVLGAAPNAGTINWYVGATGGTSVSTGASFTTPSIAATTNYFVDATANGCTTATRTSVAATVNPNLTSSVSVSSNTTSICGSAPITFTATPTNGGLLPTYQWKRNGVNVGTGTNMYVLSGALNGDSVYAIMTSNATPCLVNVTSNSNGIVLTSSTVTPTVAISANPGTTICNGTSVTFTANATNGGASPSYQWRRNGVNVGTNLPTYTSATLVTNDSISVVLTSNATCISTPTATSAASVMTVNTIPTITASTPASRCGTGTVALGATASAGTINWYSALTGGTSIATGVSFTTPSITATTTYFVDATANGCTTATRTAVAATVNTIPTITASTPAAICGTGTAVLGATASAGTINWYTALTGGTATSTGTSFTTPSITATTTYYVDATANGCTTAARTSVEATVNTIPTITASTPANRCGTGTVVLGATASAGTINWYSALTGGTSLATGVSYTTPSISATTTYFVDATANGCTTAARTSVAATVNAKPTTSAISGRTSVHSDTVETYAVTNTTGSSYVWTILGGVKLTGGTTNSITIDWDVAYTSGMVKVIETNTIGCKGDTVYKPIVSIVPVEFLSFDAKRANERVNLTWVTASEINNSHFEVERSVDNNRFEQVGTVKGNGTTSMMNTYKMVDNIKTIINSNATTVYYRLKQVDYDGEFAYTQTVTVSLNEKGSATAVLNPNPFKDAFTVEVTESAATTAEVYLLDGNGKMVRNFSMELNKGTTAYQLTELNELSSGMYFVRIITASGNSYTIKTIKK